MRYWGRSLRVVVAECIDEADKIFDVSRSGWEVLNEVLGHEPGFSCRMALVDSVGALRQLLDSEKPDVLILSAHGFYDRDSNAAGIVIGGTRVIGPELGEVPEVVLMSACHVGPRGAGVVSIADLLLRQGALVVSGTQVPVQVGRNSMVMVRVFANVLAAIRGEAPFRTFADAWHHTFASNAVNDIIQSSERMKVWATRALAPSGRPIMQEFMLSRSKGRLLIFSTGNGSGTCIA
jgi:hypothetical protein